MKESFQMKILYLSDQDLDNESGVSQKISMQAKQWLASGHEVSIVSLESLSFFSADKQRLSPAKITTERAGWKIFIHLVYSSWVLKSVLKDCDFDIVYMRYRLYSPCMKRALKNRPQIVEINSDDTAEYKHSSILLSLYNRAFRHLFLSKVDGFVCVSHELEKKFLGYKKPTIVIANGIECDAFYFEVSQPNLRPALVFIGSPNQSWHGVDNVVKMANTLPEFDFHIIGFHGVNTQNLFYYGYLCTEDANKLVAKFNIGLSTLALYKKQMKEASPLKTRQYLAQGLPIIYAYEDTDFKGENSFSLQLPNNETNVLDAISEIRDFVNKVYQDEEVRKEARRFSKNHLDVSIKEKARLSFFGRFI